MLPACNSLSRKEMLTFSLVVPLSVIAICLFANKNFFNIDDAVNEFLPFFTQMGRIWSSGHIPFISDNNFMGGNAVVELSHCAFTPQSIIASLLAWHCEYKQIAAIFIAFSNMLIISISCFVISTLYNLRRTWTWMFASFCIIQPEFLMLFCRCWYNAGIAQAWAIASIATFMLLARKSSIRNFLLNFFCVFFLLTTIWMYAIIAYAFFTLFFLIFHNRKFFISASLLILLIANILAIIAALPLYSEYVYNSDLHNRFSAIVNWNNFLVFPWSSQILNFFPTYFDFIPWYGGYKIFPLPFAFSTIFLPLIFFNRKIFTFFSDNLEAKFILALILIYFICSQLPTQILSMRYPFRFLPFISFALCLATSLVLSNAERKKLHFSGYLLFVGICWLLAVSKAVGHGKYFVNLQFVSVVLLLLAWGIDGKNWKNPFSYLALVFAVLIVCMADIKWTKFSYLSTPILYRNIEFPFDFNRKGYVFSLGEFAYNNKTKPFTSFFLNRSGFYNVRTVNGYTPLGYKNWHNFLPAKGWQQYKPQEALDTMLVPVEGSGMCRANAWRISTFVLPEDIVEKNRIALEKCGYQIGATDAKPLAYASLPYAMTKGWDKLPPVTYPPLEGIVHESHRDAFDRLYIPPHDETIKLVFPRLYWHGFRAYLDGKRLEVGKDETGFLVSVTVPAGPGGTLEFSFFPETWRYLWVCPLFSFIGIFLVIFYIRKCKPAGFWRWNPPLSLSTCS